MKGNLYRLFALVIVTLSVTVGLAAANPTKSARDNVPRFLDEINKAGFSYQEGEFFYFDHYKYADMLYAWKIARHCDGEPYCLEVGNPKDMDGVPYNDNCSPQINLDMDPERPSWASDVFVAFRNYMEPATAASADSNELVWDQAIYFGPYFNGQ
jgi:hypothetical protein